MNNIVHKLIRSKAGSGNFGQFLQYTAFLEEAASKKMVFFGEIHSVEKVVTLQAEIQKAMMSKSNKLNVIMEHFSFEMQPLL